MEKVLLGDVLDVQRGASLSGEFYSESGNRIRLTLGNFNYPSGGFKKNTSKKDIYFTGPINPKFILKKGDLITPLTEQVAGLLGTTAFIPEDDVYIQSGDIGLVTTNENRLLKGYAYYLLNSSIIKRQLGASAQQTKIRHTSPDAIKSCVAWIPSLDQQLRITNILGTLDKRLELCRRMTASLLKQLDELYDYYFGDGNQAKQNCFGHDFFEILSGYPFDSSTYSKGKYKIITIKSIKMNDFDTLAADCVESIPLSIDAECILSCGDILISLTGDTGRIAVVDEKDCLLNQRVGKILCEDKYKVYSYALLRSPYAQRYISKNSVGTSQKNISPIILSDIKTYLPDEDELKNFNSLAVPVFQKYVAEQQRAKNIIQIKNAILPLLMNGQVQVMN